MSLFIVDCTVKFFSYNFQGNKLSSPGNISSYEEALEPIDSIWELANRIRVYLIEVMNLTAFGFFFTREYGSQEKYPYQCYDNNSQSRIFTLA